MYLLEEKIWFWLLLVIPAIVLLYLGVLVWQRRAQRKFAQPELLKKLSPDRSVFKPVLKLLLVCAAVFFMVFGLVNPKIGTKLETVKREGVDIVFAIDVSKSMLAEDIAPSRIEKRKTIGLSNHQWFG